MRLAIKKHWVSFVLLSGMVVIAHTCAGLEDFDEILVLDRGRVAERGTNAELMAAGGAYALLSGAS